MTIALIVPIYNEERFLERCLKSIENQTVKFDEVILIDDYSTDGSGWLATVYAETNANWHGFLHMPNRGVGFSRNRGIIEAISDWIAFLDADDELTLDACEQMHMAIKEHADENIIQFNHWRKYEGIEELRMKQSTKEDGGVFTIDDMAKRPLGWFAVWNKLYRREWLCEQDLKFDESLEWGEDSLFNVKAIIANGRIVQKENACCIRHFDNKQSLNHLHRDREHNEALIAKLEQIRDKNERVIDEIIAEQREKQKGFA